MRLELSHDSVALSSILLFPFSMLYGLGWWTYEQVYNLGIKKPQKPHSRIVVVGNLRVGGTGKSPITVAIAKALLERGHSVVISASGYGAPRSQAASVAPSGSLLAAEWGDEPAMMRDLLPEVPLIVGRRRVLAAQLCHDHFPDAVLLLDDGFQHKPLAKDFSILVDPERPGNPLMLPAGPYREPRSHRTRADFLIPLHSRVTRRAVVFTNAEGEPVTLNDSVDLLSAIARPERFLVMVEQMGIHAGYYRFYPDHDPLMRPNLFDQFTSGRQILVTRKDWVKLRNRPDIATRPIVIVDMELALENMNALINQLESKLNGPPA